MRTSSKYVDTRFASGTSNIREQLFFKKTHIITPTRRRIDPCTLAAILLLKINSDLLDAELIEKYWTKKKLKGRTNSNKR